MKMLINILSAPFSLASYLVVAPLLGGRKAYRRDVSKLSYGQLIFTNVVIGGTIIAFIVITTINVVYYAQHGITLFGPIL